MPLRAAGASRLVRVEHLLHVFAAGRQRPRNPFASCQPAAFRHPVVRRSRVKLPPTGEGLMTTGTLDGDPRHPNAPSSDRMTWIAGVSKPFADLDERVTEPRPSSPCTRVAR
jgi:hypothetical protein